MQTLLDVCLVKGAFNGLVLQQNVVLDLKLRLIFHSDCILYLLDGRFSLGTCRRLPLVFGYVSRGVFGVA